MTTIAQLPALKARRNERAQQEARYGIGADPSIPIELRDLNAVISQMELIDIHRARLQTLLRQRTHFGANVPPHIITEIEDARQQIAQLKAICAKYRQPVDSHPVDADEVQVEEVQQTPTPFPFDPIAHVREQLRDIEAFLRHGQIDTAIGALQQLRREIGG